MNHRLTISIIEAARATQAEIWLSDNDGSRGSGRLSLLVTLSGTRRFYFRYSLNGHRSLIPLGYYSRVPREGFLTLEQAREAARRYSAMHRDPATSDVRSTLPSRRMGADASSARSTASLERPAGVTTLTLADLCNRYVDHLQARGAQSAQTCRSYVRVHIESSIWARTPAADFTAEQAAELLRGIVQAGFVTTSHHVRQLMHTAYEHACKSRLDPMKPAVPGGDSIQVNPIALTRSIARELKPRSRSPLSKREFGDLWNALSDDKYSLDVAVRGLRLSVLLGGQRALQLLRCKMSDVDFDNFTLLLHDGKGRRTSPKPHLLPLTPLALLEVQALGQIAKDLGSTFLIPGKLANKPLTDGPLSRAMARVADDLLAAKRLAEPFRYANLRSTIETAMAGLNISRHHRGLIQSHGTSGIQEKHYDRFEYMPQKREALLQWQTYIVEAAELARTTVSVALT